MKILITFTVAVLLQGMAVAQDLFVYPAKNQSAEQMEKDKFQCSSWAKRETNFDPSASQAITTQPQEKKSVTRGAAKGGLRGSAFGLGIGAITGNAARGAARGAVVGGTIGGIRSSAQNKATQQAANASAQQQLAEQQRGRSSYDRAYAACLQGRGYSVD